MESFIWVIIVILYAAFRSNADKKRGMDKSVPRERMQQVRRVVSKKLYEEFTDKEIISEEETIQRKPAYVVRETGDLYKPPLLKQEEFNDIFVESKNIDEKNIDVVNNATNKSSDEVQDKIGSKNIIESEIGISSVYSQVASNSLLSDVNYAKAIIWSEILQKPKALRKRGRSFV
ncbi:MAG: hypothetical protein PHI90_03120 [Clostridia bacterium]|nr:hypothetical protein [Clostridia bacterium]MDD4047808.1 hypothetical protein [Clostridia bacterium]